MYTARAQHSCSRLLLWRPAPQEKLLLCVNVTGPGWASPEKRSRPAHGWKGRPRSRQRSARWYQAFFFFFAGTRRSLVPHTKTKTIFSTLEPSLVKHTHARTHFFFGMYTWWELETRFARIISVRRMGLENRPVYPGSIQGSHRPVSFMRIKQRTRANDLQYNL